MGPQANEMLIPFSEIVKQYDMDIHGILHVGAHHCEELEDYEKVVSRDKILWIEAIPDNVEYCQSRFPDIRIQQAVVGENNGDPVTFNISNNGQSSSLLPLGTHLQHHPWVWYVGAFNTTTRTVQSVVDEHQFTGANFINLDIQGTELQALKGTDLSHVDYIYTGVKSEHVYEGCSLIGELDTYLKDQGFYRADVSWQADCGWGDALYIRVRLSLCIPTMNRYQYLSQTLPQYVEFMDRGLIQEIVVSDETGHDAVKIAHELPKTLPPIRLHVNNSVLGAFHNKLAVCRLAKYPYIVLIDSDNFCGSGYLKQMRTYLIEQKMWTCSHFVLAPARAEPMFDFSEFVGVYTLDNLPERSGNGMFRVLMNTGNYVVSKATIEDMVVPDRKHVDACDVIYFAILAFQQHSETDSFEFHVVPKTAYTHTYESPDGVYYLLSKKPEYAEQCEKVYKEFQRLRRS